MGVVPLFLSICEAADHEIRQPSLHCNRPSSENKRGQSLMSSCLLQEMCHLRKAKDSASFRKIRLVGVLKLKLYMVIIA